MKTLYLLRHAKSSWDEPVDDHDRPLAPRGRRAAPAMAEHMAAADRIPQRVLCSTAARARQTWHLMAPILGSLPVDYRPGLYESDPGRILDLVRWKGGAEDVLMVVGHNPSLQMLAEQLAGQGPPRLMKRLASKYPTAALAVVEFPAEAWPEVAPRAGTLVDFLRPKDLPRAAERGL